MSAAAVARIAYLSSDVLIDIRPPGPYKAAYADTYRSLNASVHQPKLVSISHSADPVPHIRASSGVTTVTLTATPAVLLQLLPRLPSLASTPLVIHAILPAPDVSDILSLRSVVPYILHSSSPQQSHDQALIAARLAKQSSKLVLHFFHSPESEESQQDLVEVKEEQVADLIDSPESAPSLNGHAKGYVNGHSTASKTMEEDEAVAALFKAYESVSSAVGAALQRAVPSYRYSGSDHPETLILALGSPLDSLRQSVEQHSENEVGIIEMALVKPWPTSGLLHAIPIPVKSIVVLEQIHKRTSRWSPFYLEVLSAFQAKNSSVRPNITSATLGTLGPADGPKILFSILHDVTSSSPHPNRTYGAVPAPSSPLSSPPHVPAHEQSYLQLLATVFEERLAVVNAPEQVPTRGEDSARPEYALGLAQAELEDRARLVVSVKELLRLGKDTVTGVTDELHMLLASWLKNKDTAEAASLGEQIVIELKALPSIPSIRTILSLASYFAHHSRWIVNSDTWSYDLGRSGLHHLISSGLNVNLLLLDTTPYSVHTSLDPLKRKKDAGLYALNRGDVYVASVAVYSSYSQVLQALVEADAYNGPSVVLAYLPYGENELAPALEVLKETKKAVDVGYWPLYRWNPSKEEPFELDSEAIKADLQEFLDRQNHLSLLEAEERPKMAAELVGGLGEDLLEARKKKAKEAYEALVSGLDGERLLIMYASDGGVAEKMAKRLAGRGKARGLAATCRSMDEVPWEDWAGEETRKDGYTVFITSTAGQGEPPQNGRNTFRAITAVLGKLGSDEKPLADLKYAVFGLGDSHYWPRPEDAQYYNKPSKDLDARLSQLGASRIADLGLGDDQDADGPQTGYQGWEALLWRALGVGDVEVLEAEPEPITNENIKIASNFLRGTIAEGLKDESTGALAPSDGQLTKFHGIYEQDDRDIRDQRKDAGLEPAYAFMIRVRLPGGVCTPEQWLAITQIADEHGNGTFKLTTRQTFQFHGVIKRHLKKAIQAINRCLLDTIAACGDVNRGVLCSALPELSHLHAETYAFAKKLSEHLKPRTTAYHEIWLDKKQVAGNAVKDMEPIYGPFYLPRKFKIAIAIPPDNDVDVFANDVGFIAIADEAGHLLGYNVSVGGGMGVTHSNKKTYPRLGDVIGFCKPEQGHIVAEKVMLVQRDNGNRADRKNARLKYTIDRMGLDNFKAAVEKLLGYALEPARPYSFKSNIDKYGWQTGYDGKHHFTMFIENGRVQDEPGKPFKTGLREIAQVHGGKFRLTANQHLILADVSEEDLPKMKDLLATYKLDNLNHTALRLSSSACVAFPTCGLAMAESERYLPVLIDKVEKVCEEVGLRNDEIVMRMTGCPNGCARPYVAEIAFVGKAPGSYLMLLGGGFYGQRLNKIYRETVTEPEILAILKPMLKRYALERHQGERFGDWTIRAGYITATTSGKEWYEGMGGVE